MPWVWTQVGLESKTEEQSFGEGEILEERANHEGNWTNPSWQLLICYTFLQVPEEPVILPALSLCGTAVCLSAFCLVLACHCSTGSARLNE